MRKPRGEGRDTIHDAKQIGALLPMTRRVWPRTRALLGDKGYATVELLHMCRAAKIKFIVPPKLGMGKDLREQFDAENLYYSDNAVFHELYRYRSVIESIFPRRRAYRASTFRRIFARAARRLPKVS